MLPAEDTAEKKTEWHNLRSQKITTAAGRGKQ